MPKIVDAAAQRAAIREAARTVFARRGLKGTGLAHVAAAAGVSRSGLYHYYRDQAALVRDVARELSAAEERLFAEALAHPGPVAERIERLANAVIERFSAWADLGPVLLEVWSTDASRLRPLLRRLRQSLGALIRQGQRRGEIAATLPPLETAALLIGAIDGLMLQVLIDPHGVPPARAMRRVLGATLRRILSPEAAALTPGESP
jgi:AcrR family transcriptional regulator